jgi:hypothetical protein
MLKDYIKIDFSIIKTSPDINKRTKLQDVYVDPSTLTTIGLRRATEGHTVLFRNDTGLDMLVLLRTLPEYCVILVLLISVKCWLKLGANFLSKQVFLPIEIMLSRLELFRR